MNRHLKQRLRLLSLTSALSLAASSSLSAQSTAPSTTTNASSNKDVQSDANSEEIVLNPFVVSSEEDKGGYGANSTLAGTRVRTDLKDVASSISVVTSQFLLDTGATSSADLLVYTPSTEVGGIRGNFSGVAGSQIYQENTVTATTRVRGLDSADNTRDYFITDIPWDSFNVGRLDLQRGPNSILFGSGSPAGIINTSVNDASFKTAYHFSDRIDEWGSVRNVLDVNQVIIPKVLSIRVAAVRDDQKFEQKPAYNDSDRHYAALRFEPKLFGDGSHTSFRFKWEDGRVNSNNPRTVPPGDDYTRWFKTGTDQYGNPNYNKFIFNAFNPAITVPGASPTAALQPPNSIISGLGLANQGRSFWPDVINYYEGGVSGDPFKTIVAQPNVDLAGGSIGGLYAFLPRAVPMEAAYAKTIGTTGGFPGTGIPGGQYYGNVVLQDPSIFDFYTKLLDGPNKHEFQNWKAYNFAFDQTFLNDRVGFELAYDHQTYTEGAIRWMAGENYNINIDINATYADGTPNPNAGRPYAGNGASAPGLNDESTTDRVTFRFTPTVELRATDFFGDSLLSKILGKHNITGLYERNTVVKNSVTFAEFATTQDYIIDNTRNGSSTNSINSGRSFEWIVYLGPSVTGNNTGGTGVNLQNIQTSIVPPSSQTARNFNATWNKPTNPTDPNYVNPAAPYTYLNTASGSTTTGTQVDNPANYVGWSQTPVKWMYYTNPTDFPNLVQGANRTRFRDISQGVTWQGYLLDGDLVPTFGWRKDIITTSQAQAQTNAQTGFTPLSFLDGTNRQDQRGESKSWGIVYHIPKKLMAHVPWDSTLSFFFDHGDNFKADATRLNLEGAPIPNARGQTKEYGVTITTLHDKLSLKVSRFKTVVRNATLGDTEGNSIGGLGQNAYFLADGVIWGYGWATYLQNALRNSQLAVPTSPANLATYGDYAGADGFTRNTPQEIAAYNNYNLNGGTAPNGRTYAGGLAVVNAWLHAPLPANFFGSFNLSPNIDPTIATKTGTLADAYAGGYNDSSGPLTGSGSTFGNHQTTVDNLSSGTEVELTFRPIKNWNLTANYVRVNATHENIDPVSVQFIGTMTKFLNGPAGQIREWGNTDTGMVMGQWNSSIVAPYAVLTNELGHEAPEVSPWRLNVISTYTFDHGPLKGTFVGGAFREEAGRILGYRFDPNVKNSISNDPNFASVVALTLGGLDVNQPYRGKSEEHFDAWVGYTRKVTPKIAWRIQLNLQAVGEKDHLIPSAVNPDGSVALARISEGMGWRLENSFDF